jgi:hypothetical protein
MGCFKKIKFWRKKKTNTPTKVDACVSTEEPRTCEAATVNMDPTVMCVAYTQTEDTRMDGGGGGGGGGAAAAAVAAAAAAAKQVYEPEMNTQNTLHQETHAQIK